MKLLRADKEGIAFKLSSGEKIVLLDVLKLYPCVPLSHHRLSRGEKGSSHAENQRLLDEALSEQRGRNKRQLRALLQHPQTFQREDRSWRLTLRHGDLEWLIQVLNDVRVGSWIALGSPEKLARQLPADEEQARHAFAMEIAGLFQIALLEAADSHPGL
jgi:hypothetical protein